jgi:hypothetical protein
MIVANNKGEDVEGLCGRNKKKETLFTPPPSLLSVDIIIIY